MGFILSRRSMKNLEGVHPDLVRVVKRAIEITPVDFMVTEGLRTVERQKELIAKGASRTMNSRHLTGHAVDLAAWVDGKVSWFWEHYEKIALAMLESAKKEGVRIEWGGNWSSFKDGPHFQLIWEDYPKCLRM